MAKLILVRGLPGSGKSTLAETLCGQYGHHLEADQFFVDCDGNYKFDINYICDAHDWCLTETRNLLQDGLTVVVTNTFATIRELKPYFEIAKEFGLIPTVIVAQNQFQNVHNVPKETLKKMKQRFTFDITPLFQYLEEKEVGEA